MSKAQLIRAMQDAGLHVETAGEREVHGLGDAGHVYARDTGRGWKLRRERSATVGTILHSEDDVARYCRPLARPVPSPAAELYFDGAELFVMEPVSVALELAA